MGNVSSTNRPRPVRRGPRRAMGHTSGILPMPRARPPDAFNLAGERVGVAPVPVAVAAYTVGSRLEPEIVPSLVQPNFEGA